MPARKYAMAASGSLPMVCTENANMSSFASMFSDASRATGSVRASKWRTAGADGATSVNA